MGDISILNFKSFNQANSIWKNKNATILFGQNIIYNRYIGDTIPQWISLSL